jgi:hypothetical protein
MIRNFTRIFLVFAFVGTLAACRTAPVYNVENDSFTTAAPSLDAAAKVIKGAGASLGWQMADQGPGHIVGRLPIRSHLAVIDINFDVEHYSIHYKDSTNLKYDGSTIHSNYNGWIENLQNAITARSSVY